MLGKSPDTPFNSPLHQASSSRAVTLIMSSFANDSSSGLPAVYGYNAITLSAKNISNSIFFLRPTEETCFLTDNDFLLHPGGRYGRAPAADLPRTVQHLNITGREPAHLTFATFRLQFSLPPTAVRLLPDHDQLAARQRQLLGTGRLVRSYYRSDFGFFRLHNLRVLIKHYSFL